MYKRKWADRSRDSQAFTFPFFELLPSIATKLDHMAGEGTRWSHQQFASENVVVST
jgi:hypothetical protein